MRSHHEEAVIKKYSHLAAHYDKRWAGYLKATHRETARRLDLGPNDRLLDIGCGTGALFEIMSGYRFQKFQKCRVSEPDRKRGRLRRCLSLFQDAKHVSEPDTFGNGTHLFGVDLSPEMLGVACRKFLQGASFAAAQADILPFRQESFDVVVSCNSFHHWHKPREGLREILRVLKPGGRIVLTDWCRDDFITRVRDWVHRLLDPTYLKAYRLTECAELLSEAGFIEVRLERYKVGPLWGIMTARAEK